MSWYVCGVIAPNKDRPKAYLSTMEGTSDSLCEYDIADRYSKPTSYVPPPDCAYQPWLVILLE